MKLTLTKVLTPLAALAIAFSAQAALPANEGFEGTALDSAWTFTAGPDEAADKSAITAYGEDTKPADRPDAFAGAANNNYLKLSTEDGILFRKVNGGEVKEIPNSGLYLDTVVQFTVTDKSDRPTPTDADKFIIWLEADEANAKTNLCVYAGYLTDAGEAFDAPEQKVYTLSVDGVDILPGSWHRLTVKAAQDIFPATANYDAAGFQIYIDGVLAVGDEAVCVEDLGNDKLAADEAVISGKTAFPSMVNAAELTLVGFSGEGKIDDVVITDQLPGVVPHNTVTLTWNTSMASALEINGTSYSTGSATLKVEEGAIITIAKSDFTFVGAATKYQFATWTASDEGIEIADVEGEDARTITVGADGTVAIVFDATTKFDVTIDLSAITTAEAWGDVTALGYQIGSAAAVEIPEDDWEATITVPNVEPGQTVTFVLGLEGYTASLSTEATGVTPNGLALTIADTVEAGFSATLVLEAPASKVFSVNGTEYTLAEIADAVAASTEGNPLTLLDNVTLESAIAVAAEKAAYINLAGKTLTGATGADVFTVAGALTITNSVAGNGGVTAAADQAIATGIAGTLTIAGDATYVGAITKVEGGAIAISAGKFSTNVAATFADGYGLTYKDSIEKYEYGILTYTISFNANSVDAEGTMENMSYTIEDAKFALRKCTFTLAGKAFQGWATSADGEVAYADEAEIASGSTGNLELYAVWAVAASDYPAYIPEGDKAKYDAWAETYDIKDRVDGDAALQKAYLLNVAPANAAQAEAEFAITSITVNADGSVTVTTPEGKNYNGTVEIVGSETVNGTYTAEKVTAKTARFFKATLK